MAKKSNKRANHKKPPKNDDNITSAESELEQQGSAGLLNRYFANRIFVSTFLLILSFAVFIPSLGNDFVWDDVSYIEKKADKLEFSLLTEYVTPDDSGRNKVGEKYFRPLYQSTLIIDNKIWNASPFGFHLTNVVLHSIAVVILYFFILLLLKEFHIRGREVIAFITSVFFALYPLHVESVSFISARGDILAAIFFFLSLIFYIRSYSKQIYLFFAAICFLLSFLSKEVALALPMVFVGYDLVTRRIARKSNLIKYLVVGFAAMAYFFLRASSHQSFSIIMDQHNSEISKGAFHVADLFINTYLLYFIKLLLPFNLNPFMDSIPGWGVLGLIAGVILLICIAALIVFSIKSSEKLTAFSLIWIMATILPASVVAIFPIALTKFADRFLYIPSAGICILFAYILYKLEKKFKVNYLSLIAAFVISVCFAVVTVSAQSVWKNNLTLWEYAVSKSPEAVPAKINYGDALRNSGRPAEALENYTYVYENSDGLNQRAKIMNAHGAAVVSIDMGNYQSAEKWLETALKENIKYTPIYYYMKGFISLRKNDPEAAKEYLQKSLSEQRSFDTLYLLGGIAYAEAGIENSPEKYKKALDYLGEAIKKKKNFARAYLLLAKTYLAQGNIQQAKSNAELAIGYSKEQDVINEAQSILRKN